jgi:2-keto-4-pentenoate hydratase/2-oxohepta-3-ene-1,7-dioic acid hydratase in catechol pathway
MGDRFYRYLRDGASHYAVERDGALYDLAGDIFGSFSARTPIPGGLPSLVLLPPVVPSKIVCVGLNYKDHAAEQNKPLPPEPLLFIKPSTSVVGPGQPIVIPAGIGRVDHEAELGVVISRRARRVPRARAWDFILGLVCVNDVTARDLQNKGAGYTRAKGFDTFAPVGPCIAAVANGAGRNALTVQGWVNGTRRQASDTSHLIFPIDQLVEYISFNMTLEPGDIISTGTPSGIGPLTSGDSVTVKVEGVGELTNPVISD